MNRIRGRFNKPMDDKVVDFTTSLLFDKRLYAYDIRGSIAHARMLARQGIISKEEGKAITDGLNAVLKEIKAGKFAFKPEMEDIHMAVEARLFEIIGDTAGKLHTARSRNDQVALDLRLFVLDTISDTLAGLKKMQKSLVGLAEANIDVIMPGYTHLQAAQPVLLAHHLLAYFEMLQRDAGRFADARCRTDVMPLGSGAIGGVAYNIDRESVAKELGFSRTSENSMDAVSDRDFVIEYLACASTCMMHLSRLAEELIIWSSAEFSFVEMDDAYATGSSLMPQKKNPDVAELVRGKTGRVFGHLIAMLTTMKSLPLAYNRDLQEDKEALFDTVDTLLPALDVFSGLLDTLKVKRGNIEKALGRGYILATDLADYLVSKGEAFRSAHGIVAGLISYASSKSKALSRLTLEEYRQFSPLFDDDVYSITPAASVASRNIKGGTSPQEVAEALIRTKAMLDDKDAPRS